MVTTLNKTPPIGYTAFSKIVKPFLTIVMVEFSERAPSLSCQMDLPTKIWISPQGNSRSSPGMPTAYFVNRYV